MDRLLRTLTRLISIGHSVVAVEHHLAFLAACDGIIDLGPGGGEEGGRLVAEGPPEELQRNPASLTGKFLGETASARPSARGADAAKER